MSRLSGETDNLLTDASNWIFQFLLTSRSVYFLVAGLDGTIRLCSSGLTDRLQRTKDDIRSAKVWDLLTEADGISLRKRLGDSESTSNSGFLLNFVDVQQSPFTLECHLARGGDGFLLWCEIPESRGKTPHDELLRLNNEFAVLTREHIRRNRELARTLDALSTAHKNLKTGQELNQHRLAFLAEASRLLAETSDMRGSLAQVARAAVPGIADWCMVDLLDDGKALQRFAPDRPAHSHPAWKRIRGYGRPLDPGSPNPIVATLASGQVGVRDEVDEEILLSHEGRTTFSRAEVPRRCNCLLIPLHSRRQGAMGVISFVSRQRRYDSADVTLGMDLSRRVAHAFDNAHLLEDAEQRAAAIRSLATQLVVAEDKERRRLALDIHDTVGQNLSAIKLNLCSAAKADPAILTPALDAGLRLLQETIESLRNLTFDLYPAMLDDLGLSATLRWYVEHFQESNPIQCKIEEHGRPEPLSTEIAAYLFRIVKELLHNVAKHAQASHVIMTLFWHPSHIRLLVVDDGQGFVPQATSGLGLRSIRERVAHFGGHVDIESRRGQGTTVMVEIPLHHRDDPERPPAPPSLTPLPRP